MKTDSLAATCVEVVSAGESEDSSLTLRVGVSSNVSSPAVKQARLADGLTDVTTRLYNLEAVSFTSACGYRQLDKLLLHAICLFCNLSYPYPSPSPSMSEDSNLEAQLLDTISTSRQSIENIDGDFEFSMRIRQHIKDMYDEVLRVLSVDESVDIDADSSTLTLKDINKLLHVYRFGHRHLQLEMCGSSSITHGDSGLEDALFSCLQATLSPHQCSLDAVLVHIDGSGPHHSIPGISHIVTQALERFDLYARRISAPATSLGDASKGLPSECNSIDIANSRMSTAENLARRTQSLDSLHTSQSHPLSNTANCATNVRTSRRSSTSQLYSDGLLLSPRTSSSPDPHCSLTPSLLQTSTLFAHVPVQAISCGCQVLLEDAKNAGKIRVVEHVPSIGISMTPTSSVSKNEKDQNIFWLNSTRLLPVVAVSKNKFPVNDDLLFYSELLMHYYDSHALHHAVIRHDKNDGWFLCFIMPVIVTKRLCENGVSVTSVSAGKEEGVRIDSDHCTQYTLSFFVKNYDISDDSEHKEFASISICGSFSDDVTYYVLHIRSDCGLIGATLTRCEYVPEKQLILPMLDRNQDGNTHGQVLRSTLQKKSFDAQWRYILVCILAALAVVALSVALRYSSPNSMTNSQ